VERVLANLSRGELIGEDNASKFEICLFHLNKSLWYCNSNSKPFFDQWRHCFERTSTDDDKIHSVKRSKSLWLISYDSWNYWKLSLASKYLSRQIFHHSLSLELLHRRVWYLWWDQI